jgi:thioredoxin 1
MLKKLNEQNFKSEVLEKNGIALVDFYADWCGPCKMVSPIVDEISNEREDITVGKINVDESMLIAMQYNVQSIPTLIVFEDGKEKSRIVGYVPKEEILKML